MYLKKIVANGFKSFADKIEIELDDEITCIVGPNGSGKSNVVDAVRWVLGEQSVKQLRGDNSMSDIIFSGSKSRNPLNTCYVELIFDNSDKYINLDYSEISIKRKAYRTGENEYFLNGERCRLKDIINILLDTGMGKSSFNIIGQGEVSQILSESSSSTREIVEEAAGVVKYKKRKEEAIRKLEKTNINLDRVEDIIKELSTRVEPLRIQSEKALEYKENKEELENLEVALLAYDIYNYSEKKKVLEEKKKKLEEELASSSIDSSKGDSEILKYNNLLDNLLNKQSKLNNKLIEKVKEISLVNSEKILLEEKNNNNNINEDSKALSEKLVLMSEYQFKKNKLLADIDSINNNINSHSEDVISLNREREDVKNKYNYLRNKFSTLEQDIISINCKIDSLNDEIESFSFLPPVIKRILNESSLSGIINIFGNLVNTDSKYEKALDVAIASSRNFIITESEMDSKNAVNYLKRENLGRCTFFPLDIIKGREVDYETINNLSNNNDFIGTLDSLVSYDKRFENIVKNQLGLILISNDLDSSTRLSKYVNRRFKVISLDGDVINVGGSITGGSLKKKGSAITLKQEISFLKDSLLNKEEEKKNIQKEIEEANILSTKVNDKYLKLSHLEIEYKNNLDTYNRELSELENKIANLDVVISSLKKVTSNSLSSALEDILKKYNNLNNDKDIISKDIDDNNKEIDRIKDKIDEVSSLYKIKNSEIHNLEKNINEITIKLASIDNKLDNALNILNEDYTLTYEKARENYSLTIDRDLAYQKVMIIKSNLKKIGMVNLDAIAEYEDVKTRYDFLCSQKDDLLGAINTLNEIMKEMDSVIEEEFTKTYYALNEEFDKVFKCLFGGGSAKLNLTDKDDMLNTGVVIYACPPGKKLKSISLLSGGEKTLTAISLLFAILNIRKVPFCLFDEVEAALDEANVDTFGKYLANYRNKTQFLIITHKKKTMEYADTLYGITMQESGVSKLVSVKLNEHVN